MGFSIDNWNAKSNYKYGHISDFLRSKVRDKDISLMSLNEARCLIDPENSLLHEVFLRGKIDSKWHLVSTWAFGPMKKTNFLPLPYLPRRKGKNFAETSNVRYDWYFPVSTTRDELCGAVFQKNSNAIHRIMMEHYCQKRNQTSKGNPLVAFTSHSPESVAFTVFSKGDYDTIIFALTSFQIDSSLLNLLRLGVRAQHPTEILAERGEFTILGELIANHGLFLKGKRLNPGLKSYVSFNHILPALRTGDNTVLQKAVQFSCREEWSWEDVTREDGATPIQLVLSDGRADLLETLLVAKAPVNGCGWGDLSPLEFAVDLKSSEKIIKLLLEHKANPNRKVLKWIQAMQTKENITC